MKKICMIIFSVALLASFAACSGTKKEETKEKEAIESVTPDTAKAEVETTVPDVKPDEAIKAFQAFVKEYAEAFNNITKDPTKFSTLASQLEGKVAAMEKLKPTFSKKQLADYQAARDLINKVNTVGK
jgi:ABC-type glycerol-3-phosphate transport system substrate-binding protein